MFSLFSDSSSRYSDWTADAGINLQPPLRTSSRRRITRFCSSSEDEMSTENLSPPKRRRKRKKENKPKKEVRNVYLKNNIYLSFIEAFLSVFRNWKSLGNWMLFLSTLLCHQESNEKCELIFGKDTLLLKLLFLICSELDLGLKSLWIWNLKGELCFA